MKKWENFFIYAMIIGGILSIRLLVVYPPYILSLAESFLKMGQGIVEYLEMTDVVSILQQIPVKVVFALMGVFHVFLGLLLFFLGRKKLAGGVVLLAEETIDVIKKGLVLYGMLFILCSVFVYSLVLMPLAILMLLLAHFIVLIGKIPLAIYFGRLVVEKLQMQRGTILCYGIGAMMMLLCESAYAIGGAFVFFIFPVLALGVLVKLVLNHGIHADSHSLCKEKEEDFDRKKIREIILDNPSD